MRLWKGTRSHLFFQNPIKAITSGIGSFGVDVFECSGVETTEDGRWNPINPVRIGTDYGITYKLVSLIEQEALKRKLAGNVYKTLAMIRTINVIRESDIKEIEEALGKEGFALITHQFMSICLKTFPTRGRESTSALKEEPIIDKFYCSDPNISIEGNT